jgi:hypothetical protein
MPQDSPPDPERETRPDSPGEADDASPAGLDGRLHRALTDMHVYAMFLEAQSQSQPHDGHLEDELEALRSTIVALREQGSAADV